MKTKDRKQTEYQKTFIEGQRDSVKNLKRGDIIYICKISPNGYQEFWEAKFQKFERGIIIAKTIRWNWNDNEWQKIDYKLGIITARPSTVFLWGRDKKDKWDRCHWLNEAQSNSN